MNEKRIKSIYKGIVNRCENKNIPLYKYYGEKGIKNEFTSYEEFKEWSLNNGYYDELTIDRKDVKSNYTKENCRWVNRTVQARNRNKLRNNTSGFTGVSYSKHSKSFKAYITVEYNKITIGYRKTAEEAKELRNTFIKENNLKYFN